MKLRHFLTALTLASAVLLPARAADGAWDDLLAGNSTAKWRGFKQPDFPAKGWSVAGGTLHFAKGSGGGDLVTREEYASFELEFDWKVTAGANSGVIYRVKENFDAPWHTGPEYQVLDDAQHGDGKNPKTSASALYALIAANAAKATKPVGDWNSGRIVLRGSKLEHWLNGQQVVATDLASPEFAKLVAGSKFKDLPRFAKEASGHICLQDHGDEVWYRNVRIRRLESK
jgi:opacity protein-like surface antigen